MTTPFDLSIIIVSWNVADLLVACLDSILAAPRPHTEIIVVDSASSDDTVERVRRDYPQVRLLAQRENVGFARGNNLGMAAATGGCLLLLNPDTVICDDALVQMSVYLDAHPDVGVVGPHTHNSDGTHQSTRRRFPTLATALFESTWLERRAPRRLLDAYYVRDVADDAPAADVDWVQGSALMLRRALYAQIGGLDEGFTMYSEELDWCRRARAAGWRVVYLGRAHIVHHGGKSSVQASARTQMQFQQSKLRYFRKHHGAVAAGVLRVWLLAQYAWQLALEAAKGAVGHKRALRRERVRAYWQILRSGLRVP